MKKLVLLFTALLTGVGSALAETGSEKAAPHNAFNHGNSFIFQENGITFSVYPDGEFDFYLDNQVAVNAHVGVGPVGITFNSGYDYNPFVQYDDYGAVIQIENVPILYDFYGRVSRIGDVRVWYRNNLVYRLGGMYVYYTPRGLYDYHTGYINVYNRVYVYRPFHRYFVRPAVGFCMVSFHPYRRYYHPVRYTYYRPYHYNTRRAYASVGKSYRYAPRADRARIYRNDSRVTARSPQYRADRGVSYRTDAAYSSKSDRRSNRSELQRSSQNRSEVRREVSGRMDSRATAARSGNPRSLQANRGSEGPKKVSRSPVRTENRKVGSPERNRSQATGRTTQVRKSGETARGRKEVARNSRSGNNRSGNTASRSRSSRSGNE